VLGAPSAAKCRRTTPYGSCYSARLMANFRDNQSFQLMNCAQGVLLTEFGRKQAIARFAWKGAFRRVQVKERGEENLGMLSRKTLHILRLAAVIRDISFQVIAQLCRLSQRFIMRWSQIERYA